MTRIMACPAALSKTLSLQRANARAKSSRAENLSDQKASSELFERIDNLFTSISSSCHVANSCHVDTQRKPVIESSKPLALGGDDGNHNAVKRSLSADIPSGYMACFSSLSERTDKGAIDLWDREFSSMSSYASDYDDYLCGLQRRMNSGSNIPSAPKGKEDACSKSSWSADSLGDSTQTDDEASSGAHGLPGLHKDCTSGCHSTISSENLQGADTWCGLGVSDKHKMPLSECKAAHSEGLKTALNGRCAGGLEEYLISRGASCTHSLQSPSARDGDEETKLPMSKGHSTREKGAVYVNGRSKYTSNTESRSRDRCHHYRLKGVGTIYSKSRGKADSIADGRNREDGGKGEAIAGGRKKEDDSYRMRVRCKEDYDRLQEMIMNSRGDDDSIEEERKISKMDGDICRKRVSGDEEEPHNAEEDVEKREATLRLPPDSVAVELVSLNVIEDFRESMYEMMMEKDMEEECEDSSMQDLLNCYLLLNPSQLHGIIKEVFTDVWIDIIMTIR